MKNCASIWLFTSIWSRSLRLRMCLCSVWYGNVNVSEKWQKKKYSQNLQSYWYLKFCSSKLCTAIWMRNVI